MQQLRLATSCRQGNAYRVARVKLAPAHRIECRWHDFAEVFWIEAGSGVHLVNERAPPVDAWRSRADATGGSSHVSHERSGRADAGERRVRSRYGRFPARTLFRRRAWPGRVTRSPASTGSSRASSAGRVSSPGCSSRVRPPVAARAVPARAVATARLAALATGLPLWLNDALRRLGDDPDALARGVPALAALAGRSREHVNRVARQGSGRTARRSSSRSCGWIARPLIYA